MAHLLIFKKHKRMISRLRPKDISQLSFILAICLLVFSRVQAQAQSGMGNCGTDGSNVIWHFTGNVLTISGTGTMQDMEDFRPWEDYRTSIKRVIIEKGVTSIGRRAFENYTNLTSVIIPESVTRIGGEAFLSCTGLTSVVIPRSVTDIESGAFADCSGLKSIVNLNPEPQGIDSYYSPFSNLYNRGAILYVPAESRARYKNDWQDHFKSFNIMDSKVSGNCGENVTYDFDVSSGVLTVRGTGEMNVPLSWPWIGQYHTSIIEVVIENGVTSIGSEAFANCTNLTSVIIPESVTRIKGHVFYNCSQLSSIIIPRRVTHIEEGAFADCDLKSIINLNPNPQPMTTGDLSPFYGNPHATLYVPAESEERYGNDWRDCFSTDRIVGVDVSGNSEISGSCGEHITYKFDVSSGMLTIDGMGEMDETVPWINREGYHTFIKKVVIGEGVTNIGKKAFENCTNLTSVILPEESLTRIRENAFENCFRLSSITIPRSVETIDNGAFMSCFHLSSVTNPNPNPQTLGNEVFLWVPLHKATLTIPAGSRSLYNVADGWKGFGNMIVLATSIEIRTTDNVPYSSSMVVGESKQLKANMPDDVTDKTVTWKINSMWHASVTPTGLTTTVTASHSGSVIITATTSYGAVASFEMNIKDVEDASLKSLILRDKETSNFLSLSPDFDPYIDEYTVNVENSVSQITIYAEPKDDNAMINAGYDGNMIHPLDVGENRFEIKVYFENGEEKVYKVTVTRRERKDARLLLLTLTNNTDPLYPASISLSPGFHPDIDEYTVNVPYSVSQIKMNAEPEDLNAIVVIHYTDKVGITHELKEGDVHNLEAGVKTVFEIKVHFGDGSDEKRFYKVAVTRALNTGIPQAVELSGVRVSLSGQNLYVDSPVAERVNIYSVTGTLVYGLKKPAGKTSFAVNSTITNLSTPVLIVKGSSGWVKKLIIGN